MKSILTLLAFVTLASADPITVTPTVEQAIGLQAAADKYNAMAKAEFEHANKMTALSTKVVVSKVGQYKPLTPAQYAAWRFSEVLDSYAKAERQARIADPANQTLIEAIARLPKAKLEAILMNLRKQVGE